MWRGGGGERERERERDRQTDRQTDRIHCPSIPYNPVPKSKSPSRIKTRRAGREEARSWGGGGGRRKTTTVRRRRRERDDDETLQLIPLVTTYMKQKTPQGLHIPSIAAQTNCETPLPRQRRADWNRLGNTTVHAASVQRFKTKLTPSLSQPVNFPG